MNVAFLTLGCKVNSYETEAVWELLEEVGYQRVDFKQSSDVYVINTCTVTNNGDSKSRKMIRQAIQTNPEAIVVVMGCFTQLKGDEVLQIEGVKIVLGTNNRHLIPNYIEEYLQKKIPINKVQPLSKQEKYDELVIDRFVKHQRAFLKIQDGCNNYCSYCIIPYARGNVRSKNKDLVLKEAKQLVHNGFAELILTGIHTGGYGLDLKDYRFSDLLRELSLIEGLKRIRISSIEISELTEDVLEVLKSSPIFVNHLHIPLQSGSERILRAMNRKYSKDDYIAKIEALRQVFDNLSVTTDVIVGFPGETEEEFREAYDFIKQVGFQELHVFPYSKRSGTKAAAMPYQVDGLLKKDRVKRLISLSDELARSYINANLNRVLDVVVESCKDGKCTGHTSNYLMVEFIGDKSMIGTIQSIIIKEESYPLSKALLVSH